MTMKVCLKRVSPTAGRSASPGGALCVVGDVGSFRAIVGTKRQVVTTGTCGAVAFCVAGEKFACRALPADIFFAGIEN